FSGENVSGWLGGVSSVIDSLKGNQGPDTVIYQTVPPPDTDQNKGLSTGALIGIVVGVIVLFVMLLALMARRKKS
uniref:hypothetical protein n=1 Tax=Phaeodactylibacter xiamenensis TaxID=1524460 RepID=UPI0024A8DD6D